MANHSTLRSLAVVSVALAAACSSGAADGERVRAQGAASSTPAGFLQASLADYDYGTVYLGIQAPPEEELTVTNVGDGNTSTLDAPIVGTNVGSGRFRFTGDCGTDVTVLTPGDGCSLGYNLDCRSPATAGPQSVTVQEVDPGTGSSVVLTLHGSCACRPPGVQCTSDATCCGGECTKNACM